MPIDRDALKQALQSHGLMLEHRAERIIRDFSQSVGTPSAAVSYPITYELLEGQRTAEADVYFECSTHHKQFDKLFANAGRRIKGPDFTIRHYFLLECKGRPQDRFVLCREAAVEPQPVWMLISEARASQNGVGAYGTKYGSFHLAYVPGSEAPTDPFMTDFAYFYKEGRQNGVQKYEQEQDRTTNLALKGAGQLNLSMEGFLVKGLYTERLNEGQLCHIIPVLLTNVPIVVVRINSAENSVSVFEDVGWVRHRNPYPNMTVFGEMPLFRWIYIVTERSLADFLRAQTSMERGTTADRQESFQLNME